MLLRMFEPVQALMNMAGVINAQPAIIRALSRPSGMGTEEYAALHGHAAQIFGDGEHTFGVLDMGKMIHAAWKEGLKAPSVDMLRARDKGMVTPEIMEFQKAWNAADGGRSQWSRFMEGDPTSSNRFMQKGVVGWTSYLTDKSEDYSRSIAHATGLQVGRKAGITNLDALDNFAHDIANKAIANYSPGNRPEFMQGAVGTPIGLFQSFIWGYYQRMFRYIETGNKGALGAQYATQAGLFGMKSVPGFDAMNAIFHDNYEGKDEDLYDSLVRRTKGQAGDILMGGTLGNIPTLFGGAGADLTSRGDATFRAPGFNAPPIWTTGKKIFQGLGAAAGMFSKENPEITGTQVAEIFSNMMPNRTMAGIIETFGAHGNDTDASGQLISQNKGFLESAYRVLGTRSMRQGQDLEAFYSNKTAMETRAAQNAQLNSMTRQTLRAHPGEDPGDLDSIMQTYIDGGGDPRYYKRWIKNNFKSATMTRSERQLEDSLKSPIRQDQAQRLLDAHVSLVDEEGQSDAFNAPMADSMDSAQPMANSADNADLAYLPMQNAQ
jgi:hypothetical protein